MKTVVYANKKGGVGKTTHSGHLAVTLEREGRGPVVMIDLDPQGSLSAWWNERESATPAFATPSETTQQALTEKLAALEEGGYRWCIIDTPPSALETTRVAIAVADLVVIPIRPGPHEIRSVGATVELCQQEGKPFAFLLNDVKPNTQITNQAILALSSIGPVIPCMVGTRTNYAGAMTDGRAISELTPINPKAAEELRLVADHIVGLLGVRKAKKEKAHV